MLFQIHRQTNSISCYVAATKLTLYSTLFSYSLNRYFLHNVLLLSKITYLKNTVPKPKKGETVDCGQ